MNDSELKSFEKAFMLFLKYGVMVSVSIIMICAFISGIIHSDIGDIIAGLLLFLSLVVCIILGILMVILKV